MSTTDRCRGRVTDIPMDFKLTLESQKIKWEGQSILARIGNSYDTSLRAAYEKHRILENNRPTTQS